jgi:hypothetical protein
VEPEHQQCREAGRGEQGVGDEIGGHLGQHPAGTGSDGLPAGPRQVPQPVDEGQVELLRPGSTAYILIPTHSDLSDGT